MVEQAADAPEGGPLVDPNDDRFKAPDNMLTAIADYCTATGQTPPEGMAATARCIFESLALRTAKVIADIAGPTGITAEVVHVVGGGSRNALLCAMTASACGVPVVAGPAECTAIGNFLIQGQ